MFASYGGARFQLHVLFPGVSEPLATELICERSRLSSFGVFSLVGYRRVYSIPGGYGDVELDIGTILGGNFPEWWTQGLHEDLELGYTTRHLLVSLTVTTFVGPSIAKFEDKVVLSFAFLRGIGKCLHFLFWRVYVVSGLLLMVIAIHFTQILVFRHSLAL